MILNPNYDARDAMHDGILALLLPKTDVVDDPSDFRVVQLVDSSRTEYYMGEDCACVRSLNQPEHILAHLMNIQMFLDRLRNARPKSEYVMESFDVTAVYTEVSNDSVKQAIRELLAQHEGTINIWSEKYYAKIRGLAMGQRCTNP
uniref:Reverse transcriptase domain-containing protein n=1 Tax=Angiostrongylus cantonensis TaxID=6313 RepID=A0A0K0DHG9_ANGCA